MYYSQFGQDEFLESFVFRGFRNGVFLEVGAHDGIEISNTLFFERERGWTGLAVEADPKPFASLAANRPAVRSFNVAAGDSQGSISFVQVEGPDRMLSGPVSTARLDELDKRLKKSRGTRRTIEVPVRRLSELLHECQVDEVHYVSMDIEGSEPAALRGLNFDEAMIHVMTIEFSSPKSLAEVASLVASHFEIIGAIDGGDVLAINRSSPFIRHAPTAAKKLAEEAVVRADIEAARESESQRVRRARRRPLGMLRRMFS